jgi:hypothetical protein
VFLNGILNMAIGLAMTFGVISLITSAVTEAIASFLELRSKTLLDGIKRLLNDPNASGLALAVYQHAAVNPLGNGNVPPSGNTWPATKGSYSAVKRLLGKTPSYVDSKGFASALIDVIQNRQQPTGFITDINDAIAQVRDPQLKSVLSGFYERAGHDVDKLHQNLADWFDHSMDRLSGDYKRRSQWINLLIAALLTIVLDIDAVSIARHIYADPGVVQHVATQPNVGPAEAFDVWSKTFPFGWGDFLTGLAKNGLGVTLLEAVPGWILTAVATLFGAPFWFDTLQRFVQIRGTGPEADADPTKPRPAVQR